MHDSRGKVVHKGVFIYDNRGNCVYSWRIQSTIRDGIFSIEPVLDTGPFAQDEEFTNTFEIRRRRGPPPKARPEPVGPPSLSRCAGGDSPNSFPIARTFFDIMKLHLFG